jgi:hypothetical protein
LAWDSIEKHRTVQKLSNSEINRAQSSPGSYWHKFSGQHACAKHPRPALDRFLDPQKLSKHKAHAAARAAHTAQHSARAGGASGKGSDEEDEEEEVCDLFAEN